MTTEKHQLFLKHLDESAPAVWQVAQWLFSQGSVARVNPTRRAKNAAEWREFTDNGDIEISHRVEVKHSSTDFTGRHDWPYPRFMVCAAKAYDESFPKPCAFYVLAASGRYLAMVPGNTSPLWTLDEWPSKKYGGEFKDYYFAPLDVIIWIDMMEGQKQLAAVVEVEPEKVPPTLIRDPGTNCAMKSSIAP